MRSPMEMASMHRAGVQRGPDATCRNLSAAELDTSRLVMQGNLLAPHLCVLPNIASDCSNEILTLFQCQVQRQLEHKAWNILWSNMQVRITATAQAGTMLLP